MTHSDPHCPLRPGQHGDVERRPNALLGTSLRGLTGRLRLLSRDQCLRLQSSCAHGAHEITTETVEASGNGDYSAVCTNAQWALLYPPRTVSSSWEGLRGTAS